MKAVEELIKQHDKYNIPITDEKGNTPLHIACKNSNYRVVKGLIDAGANVSITDKQGNTPLHIACKNSNYRVVKALIDAGANVSIPNKQGDTPLHILCQNQHSGNEYERERKKATDVTIAKELIKAGANVSSLNNYRHSATDYAYINNEYLNNLLTDKGGQPSNAGIISNATLSFNPDNWKKKGKTSKARKPQDTDIEQIIRRHFGDGVHLNIKKDQKRVIECVVTVILKFPYFYPRSISSGIS